MNEMYGRSMMGSHELEADVRTNEEEGSARKKLGQFKPIKKQNGKGGWRARKKSSSKKLGKSRSRIRSQKMFEPLLFDITLRKKA